jgi:hypothetical protein
VTVILGEENLQVIGHLWDRGSDSVEDKSAIERDPEPIQPTSYPHNPNMCLNVIRNIMARVRAARLRIDSGSGRDFFFS